jgi:hypothetical protein
VKGIAIDPQSASFIKVGGRMRYTEDDLEFLAQVVRHEISLFLGEWFMDTSKGLPYRPTAMRKSEHRGILEAALRAKLTRIKGLKRVLSFVPLYDKKDRILQVSFVVQTDYGTIEDAWKSVTGGSE